MINRTTVDSIPHDQPMKKPTPKANWIEDNKTYFELESWKMTKEIWLSKIKLKVKYEDMAKSK